MAGSEQAREEVRALAAEVLLATAGVEDQAIADRLVAATYNGRRPDPALIRDWLKGGARFWTDNHESLGEGWPLVPWLQEVGIPFERQELIATLRDDWPYMLGVLFGAVPINASDGRQAVLISHCGFASSDQPLCVVRDRNVFLRMVRTTGTLWGDDYDNCEPMTADDETLWRNIRRAARFA